MVAGGISAGAKVVAVTSMMVLVDEQRELESSHDKCLAW